MLPRVAGVKWYREMEVGQFDFLRRSMYLDNKKTAKAIAPRIPSATAFRKFIWCWRIGIRTTAIRKSVCQYPITKQPLFIVGHVTTSGGLCSKGPPSPPAPGCLLGEHSVGRFQSH